MYRQLFILQSGRKILVERSWKKRTYRPCDFSLRRCVRLLLSPGHSKPHRYKWIASSTTGGWEHFDVSKTTNTTCMCLWHREHYPERFNEEPNNFEYPESDANYVAE